MNRKQSGVTLSGLLIAAVILAMLSLLGMKVAPEVMEYLSIKKAVKAVANDPGSSKSVSDVRKAFDRYATIDNITAITPQDLDVTKDGGDLVVSFAYERRVPLFTNVSLLLYFEGSSKE